MSKEIVMNVGERETRIAVTEDGRLVELHLEREERVVGNIAKGRVENVLPGMDCAFVDVGLSRNAFLYVGDVLPTSDDGGQDDGEYDDEEDSDDEGEQPEAGEPLSGGRPAARRPRSTRRSALRHQKIGEVLKVGQEVLVQITKGPRGTKGARVSTRVSLPGRYLVLMPEADNVGVSRKVEDAKERDRLRKIGESIRQPGFGIIIRTEAEDKSEQELQADEEFLRKLWRQIQEQARKVRAPSMIHRDLTLVNKTIRDIFGSDVSRMVIDDPAEYEKANELLEMVSPKLRGRIHLYTGDAPVFDHFGLEAELDKTLKRKVWLRSGGYLIFDETEALTVVDVNTGKFVGGHSLSETIVRTNVDAAAEIARQLRLRDIGGIIVVDFIDMNHARDKQQVLRALETALKKDRSRTKISNISPLGLVEMTRKRTTEALTDFLSQPCEYCGGRGKVPSAETLSLQMEREIHRAARSGKKDREALYVQCHQDVAELLIGEEGGTIDEVERDVQRAVYVRAMADVPIDKFDIQSGDIADFDRRLGARKRFQVVECVVERSRLQPEQGAVAWAEGYLIEIPDGKRFIGQKVKVKLTDIRRSFARASVIPGTNRGLDRPEPA